MFGWDLITLYKQPAKRINEFIIVISERKKQQKQKELEASRR